MSEVRVDFEAVCATCGKALAINTKMTGLIEVDPCDYCMDNAYNEGIKEGEENDPAVDD